MNIGFWIRSLGEGELAPHEHACHLRGRAERQLPPRQTDIQDVLYPETRISDNERVALLEDIVRNELLGFLDVYDCLSSVKTLAKSGTNLAVLLVARPVLGLDPIP